jgi:repressor LexA
LAPPQVCRVRGDIRQDLSSGPFGHEHNGRNESNVRSWPIADIPLWAQGGRLAKCDRRVYKCTPMNNGIPPKRATVLAFLRDQLERQGRAPSLAEIATEFGFASRNAAQKHVQALVADGLIELIPGQKRGIRLVGGRGLGQLVSLPVLGRVAAGAPIGADIGLDQQLWLDRTLFSLPPDYLLLVQGDSMVDDGILDGDLVGVHHSRDARNGQTVVARVDEEITIKRFEKNRNRIRLLPRNAAHEPIVVQPGQDFAIEGIYCGLVRRG